MVERDDADPHSISTSTAGADTHAMTPATLPDSGSESSPLRTDNRELVPTVETNSEWATATELGGVFFLIAALRALDLFIVLDEHFGVGDALGSWAWLELLARSLIGENQAYADDPIWAVLALLDGRDPSAPFAIPVVTPTMYAMPDRWAQQLAALGIDTVDVPTSSFVAPVVCQELRALVPLITAVLRAQLLTALELPLDEPAALVPSLLACPATVVAGPTHVDVRIALDHARSAVRIAGLDANPGWVPELGRVVTFYFD
jgi:hypothetical protein